MNLSRVSNPSKIQLSAGLNSLNLLKIFGIFDLKLKYPNLYLQHFEKPTNVPEPMEMQYTQVLTKQSALFNAWKEMNRVSNE